MELKRVATVFFILMSMFVNNCTNTALCVEFSDVPQGYWAYKEIDKITDWKIMHGDKLGRFNPSKKITRAEYAVAVIKAIGQEKSGIEKMYSFEDIDNKNPAFPYLLRAINLGITEPIDEKHYYPDEYVSKAEIITFLVNILKSEEITKKEAIYALQNTYADFDDIPDWFKITAGKAEVLDIVAKEPPRENYLDCNEYLTKGQTAVFLYNFRREIAKYKAEKIEKETSPKIAEGITLENVIRQNDVVTIPIKTLLPIVVSGQINSDKSNEGQMFKAKFVNNLVDKENHLLLSKDILLVGKILEAKKSKLFLNNGEIIFELSAVKNNNIYTRIMAYAECEGQKISKNKIKKVAGNILKGNKFVAKDGDIIYVKLFRPIRVNIVTGEVLD